MNESREKAEFEYFDGQEENESNYRRFNDWRNGYDSRDAEVEALRTALDQVREELAGWLIGVEYEESLKCYAIVDAALSSGTQETK